LALFLNVVSASVLFILMLLTCVDVIGRYVFNSPLTGSIELTEMAVAAIVFTVFPIISWRGENVVVDLMDRFVSHRIAFIRTIVINLCTSAALLFVGQRIILLGNRSLSYGERSEYLSIPSGWMINFIGLMCWICALLVITVGIYRALVELRATNLLKIG